MSTEDVMFEVQRSLGRIEATQAAQFAELKAEMVGLKSDVAMLKAQPAKRWGAVGKWIGTVAATVVAAVVAFRLKVLGH